MFRSILVSTAILALSGCMETIPHDGTPKELAKAVHATQSAPEPGTKPVSADQAYGAFENICLDGLPRFAGAQAKLKQRGYNENPSSGTFYDPKLNMSFNLTARGGRTVCSIVFQSNADPAQLAFTFAVPTSLRASGNASVYIDPKTNGAVVPIDRKTTMRFEPMNLPGPKYYRGLVTVK